MCQAIQIIPFKLVAHDYKRGPRGAQKGTLERQETLEHKSELISDCVPSRQIWPL
jgi:hypothetical protein